MPPLSCAQSDVSWMSQYCPSEDGRRVTAPAVIAAAAANANDNTTRFTSKLPHVQRRRRFTARYGRASAARLLRGLVGVPRPLRAATLCVGDGLRPSLCGTGDRNESQIPTP